MLHTRVTTAIFLGIGLLGSLYLGGIVWGLLVTLLAVAAFAEYLRLWVRAGAAVSPLLTVVGGAGAALWPLAAMLPAFGGGPAAGLDLGLAISAGGPAGLGPSLAGPGGPYAGLLLGLVVATALTALVLTYPASSAGGALAAAGGSVYVGWSLAHLVLLRDASPAGFWRTFLVFAGVWATDVLAYFIGTAFGRHKLNPALSPGKSVEGLLGGLLGGVLAAWLVGIPLGLPPGLRLGLGAAISLLGQVGDLAESAVKRYAGVKDSGSLLPGHGGFLDRFDSTLLAAPLVYYVLAWWAQRGGGF